MLQVIRSLFAALLVFYIQVVHADIPKATVPSGADESDIVSVIVAYVKLAMGVVVVALGVFAIVVIASKLIKAFADWQNNKIEADRFLGSAFIGGFVIVIVGFLLWYTATYWIVNIVV